MTPEQLQELLRRRERTTLEFKEARRELPRSLFKTVCAFLNRDGGTTAKMSLARRGHFSAGKANPWCLVFAGALRLQYS